MPSMGGMRTRCAYLKGCHIALGSDSGFSGLEAVARRHLDAGALQHDVHGAVLLLGQLDRALDVRLLPRALEDVRDVELLEDSGRVLRPLGLELDLEGFDGLPLLREDVDDVEGGAAAPPG